MNFLFGKTRKNKERKGPTASATEFPEGTIEFGNDKRRWVIKKTEKGVPRWIPFSSTTLHGYAPLTRKYLASHINTPVSVFERASSGTWPKRPSDFDVKYTFTASGDAVMGKTKLKNWLKKGTPSVKEDDICIIEGVMKSKDIASTLQVGCAPDSLISTNLMNTDAFVKLA
jgi:hypothetical protein